MKKISACVIIALLVLVVSQPVSASANLTTHTKSRSSTTQSREDQLIGVNLTPINVKSNGTLTATGYVQWYCQNCSPPGWQPACGVEVHLDRVASDGSWYVWANGTTDSNGYFTLSTQLPLAPGPWLFGVLVPSTDRDFGTRLGPWIVTVY